VLVDLYQRAALVKQFPAYRLDELRDPTVRRELLWGLQMLNGVEQMLAPSE
jgi:hypothetical protein